MATPASSIVPDEIVAVPSEPMLESGDRLSRDEFERRYERLAHVKKAELIEGIVYIHQKKGAYRRNGVCEYLAWITSEKRLVWWQLSKGEYQEIPADGDGLLRSRVFPGLWLEAGALLRGDLKAVLAALRRGLESPEHAAFLAR